MAVKKTFDFFLRPLLKKFFQDMGREPNNLEMILIRQKAGQQLKDSNKIIQFPQKSTFMEQVEAMKKSGDLVDEDSMIISDKITERDMFKNSFLNKPVQEITEDSGEGFIDFVRKTDPEGAAKLQKTENEIKAAIEAGNKRAIENLKKKKKKSDEPDDMATGGRAGHYTGGIADVEPSLDDIGHGSDSLMARTRLMSPGSQSTTSTGLNYLLAEDNDNIRVPFANGNGVADEDAENAKFAKRVRELMDEGFDMGEAVREAMKEGYAEGGRIGFSAGGGGRRAFLKLLATLGGGIAGIKSGLFGMGGKEATKKAVTETVKQSAGSGTPPPYFFKLVEKIKTMGDDVTAKNATQERQQVTRYKDFELTEDVGTGEQTIQKIKTDTDFHYYDETLAREDYMNYKPGAGQSDEAGRVADEYIEDTGYLRTSGPDKGELYDSMDGLTDDALEEIMKEVGEVKIKKSSGGIARMIGE